ncbi:MAG: hypothetical protein ACOYVF_11520 [Candidatus Zixiibacteriota bacterium]
MRKATKKATKKKVVRKKTAGKAKVWTAAEIATLKKLYKTTATSKIAKQLKRSLSSVQTKARSLGLKKSVVKKAAKKVTKKVAKKKVVKKAAPKKKAVSKKKTAKKAAKKK